MPQLVLSGSLKGPTGEPAANAEITFTSRRTTDIVLQQTVFTARADAQGDYQIALEYGVFDISVKLDTATVSLAQRVEISEQTTATTLNQLIIDHQGEQAVTPQIIVEFRELTAEARGYRDEAQAFAQSASENATATAADRQAVADNRTHVDQQRQAVDDTADAVEADRLAAQTARTGAEDAQGASETARDESRAWATGDGVIDNISGTDRFSARVEADRAASERQSAESAATASSDSATLAGQRATTAGEHEAAAGDSATEAEHWATYPIDTPVPEGDGSQYSSRHWAEISRQRAVNAMVAQGAWDASTGALPAEPVGASYWLVTGASNGVTVEGVEYRNKDMLLWTPGATSGDPGQWSKIDNTDSVVSVAGKSGAVELVPGDVGADPAGTAAQEVGALESQLGTAAYQPSSAFDAAGSAQAAQDYAIQRANHTGTQPLSTISDAGSAAARDVGTSPGNVMEVGAFGLGVEDAPFVDDFAKHWTSGFYKMVGSETLNGPYSSNTLGDVIVSRPRDDMTVFYVTKYDDETSYKATYTSAGLSGWRRYLYYNDSNADFSTMPKVSGDPIVESGGNSFGEWVRWADGTQRCRASLGIGGWQAGEAPRIHEWEYPMPFVDNPEVTGLGRIATSSNAEAASSIVVGSADNPPGTMSTRFGVRLLLDIEIAASTLSVTAEGPYK